MTVDSSAVLSRDTWDRAYCDVLFRHIDRLNDVCEEDTLEDIAQSIRDAFEQVVQVDPVMNRNEAWVAKRASEPWPVIGTTVWYPEGALHHRPLKPATVALTFRGDDGRIWCLLKIGNDYSTRPAMGVSPTESGPTYLELSMKNPAMALKFLQAAGICDETGNLAARFRDPDEPAA